MNPYDILGVPPTASAEEVKQAFRRAAARAHPDRNGGDTSRMADVNAAYELLSDEQRREEYDAFGSADAFDTTAAAHELIGQLFMQFMNATTSAPCLADPVAGVKAALGNVRITQERSAEVSRQQRDRALKAHLHLKCSKGADSPLHTLLADAAERAGRAATAERRALQVTQRAVELLDDYSWTPDVQQQSSWGATGTSTTFYIRGF